MDRLLTVREAAEKLNCHPHSVYRLVESNEIPHIKRQGIGLRFNNNRLEEWLEKSTKNASENRLNYIDNQQYRLTLPLISRIFISDEKSNGGKGEMAKAKFKTRLNLGYGAIYQRKTKQGKIRWYLDYNGADGKRVQKVVGNAQTKEEAVIALQTDVFKAFSKEFNVKGQQKRPTFVDFADQYLDDYAKVNKATRSWKSDEYYLRAMKAYFGESCLDEITSQDVERYKAFRLSQGVRKSTVNRCLSILRKMLNLGAEWGRLEKGRIPKIRLYPEKDNLQERILAPDEEERLIKECSSELRPIVLMALNTGMRLGEILSQQWVNVDLENHAIRIPKTKSGRIRIVNINAILSSVLQTLKSTNGSSPLLFPNPKTGLALKSVRTAFKAACRRAEIKGLRFHDLRHTFASRLVRMGVDLITVKEILGHSSVTTTERYTHTLQEQKQRAVDLLAGAESGKNAASLLHICDTERRVKKAGSLSHSNQIN